MLAVNPMVGVMLAVVLFFAERYLGGRGGTVFILMGVALIGAFFGPLWAAAALAGSPARSARGRGGRGR